jgi:hypothetical protein
MTNFGDLVMKLLTMALSAGSAGVLMALQKNIVQGHPLTQTDLLVAIVAGLGACIHCIYVYYINPNSPTTTGSGAPWTK